MSETIDSEFKVDDIQSLIERMRCEALPAPERMSVFASLEEKIGSLEDFDRLCGSAEGRLEVLRNSIVTRELKKLIGRGIKKVRLTYTDGSETKRMFISGAGDVCEFGKHRRRYGRELAPSLLRRISKIEPVLNKSDFQTHAEQYADEVRKWRNFLLKNLHRNLWGDLRRKAEPITDEMIVNFGRLDFESHYEAWKAAPDNGLPSIEGYKITTLKSCAVSEMVASDIADAIEHKRDFSHAWRGNYDYSASANTGEDGIYRAWFSAEFKGCGNGHYYLLLNNNNAIFGEDD